MRILILTFYYPPDLDAGSFRANALVHALLDRGPSDLKIDVITTAPNRYQGTNWSAPNYEREGPVTIRRLPLPRHKSGMVDQSISFSVFARGAWKACKSGSWDLVFATSSRLMTAALGAEIARRNKAPLYLDYRDLFTDTMEDLLASQKARHVLPLFKWLEKRTFNQAERVSLASEGFVPHMQRIAPRHSYRTFTNGIDEIFMYRDFSQREKKETNKKVILYAGNLGEGQGLHHILPDAAKDLESQAHFQVIGDGGKKSALEKAIREKSASNIELINPIPREKLFDYYREADILFLHLNSHSAFEKVLPSKIFEYAATQKPILAGVGGYARYFLDEKVPGSSTFPPCDREGLKKAFDEIKRIGVCVNRDSFIQEHSRHQIMQEMACDILDLAYSGKKRQ